MRHVPLLLIALLCQSIKSQPPVPTPTKSTQKNQNDAPPKKTERKSNQQPSAPSPSVLNQSGSVITIRDQQQTKNNSGQKTPNDWWAIANTGLITLFTGLLAWLAFRQWRAMEIQAGYMRDALAETRKAACAATKSAGAALKTAEGFMHSERAWLIIETSEMDLTQAVFKFTNYGRTPARLTEIGLTYVVRASSDIWPVDYSELDGVLCASHIIAPKTSTLRYRATVKYATEVMEGGPQFRHVYGIVRYKDIFGCTHATPFYYSLQSGTWLLSGPQEANSPD